MRITRELWLHNEILKKRWPEGFGPGGYGLRILNGHIRVAFRVVIPTLLMLVTLFFALVPAAAQTIDAKVDFFLVPPEEAKPITVGDHIRLRLEVNHPADSSVDLPKVEDQWGDLEVVDQTETVSERNDNGSLTTGKDIIVRMFEPGKYETPSLVVSHQKADGETEELGTPVIRFTIDSVLVEGDTELRDLKEQAVLPVPPIWPLLLASLMLAVLIIGVFAGGGLWLYHRWQHRQMEAEMPLPVIDTRPPEVIAYEELNRIETLDLPAASQFKDHYSLVTECLRRYIEGRYRITALEQTTNEIEASFSRSTVPAAIVRDFLGLFRDSDLVKFARFQPHVDDAYELTDQARVLVKETTPLPPIAEDAEEPQPEMEAVP